MAASIAWRSITGLASGLLFFLCLVGAQVKELPKSENNGCSQVKTAYASKGFSRLEVPSKMISGEHLRICPQGFTCCTQQMEHKLSTQSRQEFDRIMADKISVLRNTFISRTAKFDAFFTELLDNAKRDLHEMFVRTYGLLYQQNSHVFTDLFNDLRSYYKGRDLNLLDTLDGFFVTLLQKMFLLLNAQYTFDDKYMQCVAEHMDELKPFGDVPKKLAAHVKRAFIAARTFVQGLAIGRDVILAISKVGPSQSCSRAFMKMMYCPYCRSLPSTKPCNNFCMNVMKGCLASQADLNADWNNYIGALMKLATRLEGPFNIESVVDPIDVQISDAIMNYQENSEAVSNKVFQGCGRPQLSRDKRSARSQPPDGSSSRSSRVPYAHDWKYSQKPYVRPTTAYGTSLDRLVRDIRQKVQVSKDFWKSTSHSVCNGIAAPLVDVTNCWNGLGKSRYLPEVMADGAVNQLSNPEVDVDVRRPNFVANQQILRLKLITNKLNNAHNGLDVDWIDTSDGKEDMEEDDVSGSGSGSGSGDGYKIVDPDLSFTQTTRKPVVVRTHMPPRSEYPLEDRPHSSARSAHVQYILPLVTILLLVIGACCH